MSTRSVTSPRMVSGTWFPLPWDHTCWILHKENILPQPGENGARCKTRRRLSRSIKINFGLGGGGRERRRGREPCHGDAARNQIPFPATLLLRTLEGKVRDTKGRSSTNTSASKPTSYHLSANEIPMRTQTTSSLLWPVWKKGSMYI